MLPKIPTRTDAYVQCDCGGTAKIAGIAPIPQDPGRMRHFYACAGCDGQLIFDVAKKGMAEAKEPARQPAYAAAPAEEQDSFFTSPRARGEADTPERERRRIG